MEKNLYLIANGNASEATRAYNEQIRYSNWMKSVKEDDIYDVISSPEFHLYMEILGLGEQTYACGQVA